MKRFSLFISLSLFSVSVMMAQKLRPVNYDESKVPNYVLPDVLTCKDGTKVTTVKQWEKIRRPEIMDMLYHQEYGVTPKQKIKVRYETLKENPTAMNGKATSKQVKFIFSGNGREVEALLLMYIPNHRTGKVPVFIGYNFNGNRSTVNDPDVLESPGLKLMNASREVTALGAQSSRWEYELAIDRGYAVATMCYNDIYPDKPELRDNSVVALFDGYDKSQLKDDEWQAIGAWAWGSSRIADYIVKQKWADKNNLAIMGHSRQGKAALWAGAQDKRFKVVISNDSGCGGAALSMRAYGETVAVINKSFPHWFCKNFRAYGDKEETLPFDQHELIAMVAPRYVYVASAQEDRWADQRGEFTATTKADDVYHLYGMKGLETTTMPDIHQPIMNASAYHIRAGKHDVTRYDWSNYLDFCDKHFK